jgi:hypothetical protein
MAPARRTVPAAVLGLLALALTACNDASRPDTLPGPAAPAVTISATATGSASGTPTETTPSKPPAKPANPATYADFFRDGMGTLVPAGWTKNQDAADHTDFRDASGELLLRLSAGFSQTRPDAYLKQLAATTAKNYPGYKLIKLTGTEPRQSQFPAAEWEFTFVKDGVTRHVVLAAVGMSAQADLTGGQIYYSAPVEYFDTIADAYLHALNGVYFAG